MITKKICMVGAFATGKTSLVERYVESIYSEKYQTTIGVKISKKLVTLHERSVKLLIWDIEGVDIFTELSTSYLRGSSGILLVVDGTRPKSYDNIQHLIKLIKNELKDVPIVLVANKNDLTHDWKMDDNWLGSMSDENMETFSTSAKYDNNVDEAFQALVMKMLDLDARQKLQ